MITVISIILEFLPFSESAAAVSASRNLTEMTEASLSAYAKKQLAKAAKHVRDLYQFLFCFYSY
jgi:beta-lactamase regulating signal transducer with metallopeptidase domain